MLVHHIASQWNPYHWMFIIGGLLVAVVIFARGGILGMADAFGRWIAQRRGAAG
jgi:branched-chain amino acid transport system permease protein